jgi:hypothetical protein
VYPPLMLELASVLTHLSAALSACNRLACNTQTQPTAGAMILFPPWCRHSVPPSDCSLLPGGEGGAAALGGGGARTAFSFNLHGGGWGASKRVAERWAL